MGIARKRVQKHNIAQFRKYTPKDHKYDRDVAKLPDVERLCSWLDDLVAIFEKNGADQIHNGCTDGKDTICPLNTETFDCCSRDQIVHDATESCTG